MINFAKSEIIPLKKPTLTKEETQKKLLKDEFTAPGSAKKRESNAPEKGKTTLLEVKNA